MEKQIAAARTDEVVMAAIRVDPQILEEHLAVEATVDVSRTDAVMWLAALNDSSWRFLEATVGAFDEDGVFSAFTCLPHLESQQVGARSGSGNSPLQRGHPRCGGLALFHVQGANCHRYLRQ